VQPEPALFPAGLKGLSRIVAQWADEKVFWAAMAWNFSPKGAAQMFGGSPDAPIEQWGEIARVFGEDRAKMRSGMPRMPVGDAAGAYKSYLRRLSHMLDEHPFLLGDAPCVADFSAYHPLWFTRQCVPVMADIFAATPAVLEWMDRIAALGHGRMEKFSAQDAITVAAGMDPLPLMDDLFQDEHGIPLGTQVAIAAESFGTEPTEGELIAATRTRYTLRRTDPRAGTVHVHFPRIGYVLRAVKS